MNENEGMQNNFMLRVSAFIVDKRNLIFLVFVILFIFSAFPAAGCR